MRVVRTDGATDSGAKLCKLEGARRRMALSQNAARQPTTTDRECIGRAKRSQPNVVDSSQHDPRDTNGITKSDSAARGVHY